MHVLTALGDLQHVAKSTQDQMYGPTETNRCMSEFAERYEECLTKMLASRLTRGRQNPHPIIALLDAWCHSHVCNHGTKTYSMENWNAAFNALELLHSNVQAMEEFLTLWGGLSKSTDDSTPIYLQRDPEKEDAPEKGGGRLREIWNATAIAFQKRVPSIPMPMWTDATRTLFLTKSGRPSRRAKILRDDKGLMHGFYVRTKTQQSVVVEAVGLVSAIEKLQCEALGVTYAVLSEAFDLSDPDHQGKIHLDLPRPQSEPPRAVFGQGVIL